MTRATVEDSTEGLGQTLRTGRPLVGGLSFHGISELRMNSLARWLSTGIQAQGARRGPCGLVVGSLNRRAARLGWSLAADAQKLTCARKVSDKHETSHTQSDREAWLGGLAS